MLIDSHCHPDFPELFERLPEVWANMQTNDVAGALCIGVKLEDFPQVQKVARAQPTFFASVGVHPECTDVEEPDEAALLARAKDEKVIAIGETGLDYHWHANRPEWQRARFRTHIRAAKSAGLPLVIHTRKAAEDTLAILKEEGAQSGIFHCFSENWAVARQALDLGFYISFSGIVTFKNAKEVKEVAQKTPIDRILVETDAPYLAPVPFRGKPNEPAYVRHTAEEIARLRGVPFEEIAQATTENFWTLFPRTRAAFGG